MNLLLDKGFESRNEIDVEAKRVTAQRFAYIIDIYAIVSVVPCNYYPTAEAHSDDVIICYIKKDRSWETYVDAPRSRTQSFARVGKESAI